MRDRLLRVPGAVQDEVQARIAADFAAYAEYVHRLRPAAFQEEWAKAMADPGSPRLVIVAPPESGKTAWCIAFCAWLVAKDPSVHIGYVGNTAAQAYRQSVAVRDTIRGNPRFRELFPDVMLNEAKGSSEREWFVHRPDPGDKDATFLASGFRGPLLGARLDVALLDDYSDQENTSNPEQQERAWEWLQQNAMTRLNPDRGRLICVQTRWAQGDVVGRLEEVGARVLSFPALNDDGEPLWPERWGKDGLAKRRREMGSRHFDLHYMGLVLPRGGNVFKSHWWSFWDATLAPESPSRPTPSEPPPTPASLARAARRAAREAAQREQDAAAALAEGATGDPGAEAGASAPDVVPAQAGTQERSATRRGSQQQGPPQHGRDSDAPPGANPPPLTTENRQLTTLPKTDWTVLSVDTASKTGLTNDYSAATVWGRKSGTGAAHYLLHAWRGRLEFPDLVRKVEELRRQWAVNFTIVEDKGAGQALVQELQRRGIQVTPVNPTADKVTRAIGVTAEVESGRVFLPRHAGWLEDFRHEVETFPRARHDDWVDTMVQYLEWAGANTIGYSVIWFL